MSSKWWRWPEDEMYGRVPWWTILRRLLALPLLAAGVAVTLAALVLGHGWAEVPRAWRGIR